MQTFTSHEFNQRASEAQKAAHTAPVLITLQGKPDLVLISHAEYARLTGQKNAVSILEALGAVYNWSNPLKKRKTAG